MLLEATFYVITYIRIILMMSTIQYTFLPYISGFGFNVIWIQFRLVPDRNPVSTQVRLRLIETQFGLDSKGIRVWLDFNMDQVKLVGKSIFDPR